MKATDRFPGYVELRGQLDRWPGHRTRAEQREIIRTLIATLFSVWDSPVPDDEDPLRVAAQQIIAARWQTHDPKQPPVPTWAKKLLREALAGKETKP